jgi:hypothetical protein
MPTASTGREAKQTNTYLLGLLRVEKEAVKGDDASSKVSEKFNFMLACLVNYYVGWTS